MLPAGIALGECLDARLLDQLWGCGPCSSLLHLPFPEAVLDFTDAGGSALAVSCLAGGMKLPQPAPGWQASMRSSAARPMGSSSSHDGAEFMFYISGTAETCPQFP